MLETLIENYGREALLTAVAGGASVVVVIGFFWTVNWVWKKSRLLVFLIAFIMVIFAYPDLPLESIRAIDRTLGVPQQKHNEDLSGSVEELADHISSCSKAHFNRIWDRDHWDELPSEIKRLELNQVVSGIENSSALIKEMSNDMWQNFNLTDQEMTSFSKSLTAENYLAALYANCAISYAQMKA